MRVILKDAAKSIDPRSLLGFKVHLIIKSLGTRKYLRILWCILVVKTGGMFNVLRAFDEQMKGS